MAIIDTYRDPLVIKWWIDDLTGEKKTIPRTNESYVIIKNFITLAEIPSEFHKINTITIGSDTLYEAKLGTILDDDHFSVNYTLGIINFTSTHDGQTALIPSWNSRGIIYYPSSRIYTELDNAGNVKETLADIFDKSKVVYKTPVASYSNIASTYSSPLIGWAVQVEDTGRFYRWDGSAWQYFQILHPTQLAQILTDMGDVAFLTTTDKSSLVNAINEHDDEIGVLSNLTTIEKSNIVGAINEHVADIESVTLLARTKPVLTLNELIAYAKDNNICKIVLERGATYTITDTLDFTGITGLEIDFNWSTLIDNVQGFIASAGGRGKHTFLAYNCKDIKIRNLIYQCAETRSYLADGSIPTILFWIGGQYLGGEETSNIEIENIKITNEIPYGMITSTIGETFNTHYKNFEIHGDWYYGFNFEYGLAPTELDKYGKHPHDCLVENIQAYDNYVCRGFLRVASCYNIKFLNCDGYDVTNFIYAYSGDRNISRFSENVVFENCKHYNGGGITVINYCVSIVIVDKDGSTGVALPDWTNYNHTFKFVNCEFQDNMVVDGAALRFYGNKGKTVFENCIFSNSRHGVKTGTSTNVTYTSNFSLTFNNCIFKGNVRDALLDTINGAEFNHCSFIDQIGSLIPVRLQTASYNKFNNCYFNGILLDTNYIDIASTCSDNFFNDNIFNTKTSAAAIACAARSYGRNNIANHGVMTTGSTYGLIGQDETMVYTLIGTDTTIDADKKRIVRCSGVTATINGILNGKIGDEVVFEGLTLGANITFAHLSASVGSTERLFLAGSANLNKTGNYWTVRVKKTDIGWIQL